MYVFLRKLANVLMSLLFKITVNGKENIIDGAYILTPNHRSNFDPIIILKGLPVNIKIFFMAKDGLFKFKPLGAILRHLGAFPVSRGKGDTQAVDFAVECVKKGRPLVIFPEGKRSETGELLKLKSGAVVVAKRTKADIIPVGIKYEGKLRLRKKITLSYGEPIKNEEILKDTQSPAAIIHATKLLTQEMQFLLKKG